MSSYLTVDYNDGTEGSGGYAPMSMRWRRRVANLRSRCWITRDKALGLEDAAIRELHPSPFLKCSAKRRTSFNQHKKVNRKARYLKRSQFRSGDAVDADNVRVVVALSFSRVASLILICAVFVPFPENPFRELRRHFRFSAPM